MMNDAIINKFRAVIAEYKRLGISTQVDYNKFYLYSIITHSTAIEGSTVTEIENQLLFDEGLSIAGKPMVEQLMNLDLMHAYRHAIGLSQSHEPISMPMLQELSALVMRNTGGKYSTLNGDFDSSKGELRLCGVTAGPGGRSYMNFQKIPDRLKVYCDELNIRRQALLHEPDEMEAYLLSFDAHNILAAIHPWVDGNGRMARLVMNYVQMEFGLIPTKVVKEDRAQYIQALIDSREEESMEPFRRFMLEEHTRNIEKEIEEFEKSQRDDLTFDGGAQGDIL